MPQVVDRENAEHYVWDDGCDGRHLLREAGLGVIKESMPVGTHEQRHGHHHARQIFHVLTGAIAIECDVLIHTLQPGQGWRVEPVGAYQVCNGSQHLSPFLAISSPHNHRDRSSTVWQRSRP